MSIFQNLFYFFNILIFIYVLIVDGFYLWLLILSIKQLKMYLRRASYSEYDEISTSQLTWPISILVPAYNEALTIKDSLHSFLNLNYPEYEVIVINDGSTDGTLTELKQQFHLTPVKHVIRQQIPTQEIRGVYRSVQYPNLIVIDKENGGKSDALNAGINTSNYPYVCGVDADSILEQDALLKTMRPFLEGVENVVACGGIVRIANGCNIDQGRVVSVGLPKNQLALYQVIEYLRSFLTGRLGLSAMNNLLIISGAFGVFRKADVIKVGGYNTETVGEDMELIIRLQKYLYQEDKDAKVLFVPDPVCWTEAPESLGVLYRQRSRWYRGLIECLILHRDTLFNGKYKSMGYLAMPYFLIVELFGPVIELVGTVLLIFGLIYGWVNVPFAVLFGIFTLVFGIFLSVGAVMLEEISFRRYPRVRDLLRLVTFSVIENFWYRQLNAVWRSWSFIRFVFGRKQSWGHMERKGLSSDSQEQENKEINM